VDLLAHGSEFRFEFVLTAGVHVVSFEVVHHVACLVLHGFIHLPKFGVFLLQGRDVVLENGVFLEELLDGVLVLDALLCLGAGQFVQFLDLGFVLLLHLVLL